MKQIPGIFLAAFLVLGFSGNNADAATVEQALNISVVGSYVSTKAGPGAVTNNTIKTATITTATVVKALAYDLNLFQGPANSPGNLANGQLIHIISLPSGTESIVIRKAGTADTDVTGFFGPLGTNFFTTSDTNNFVKTALENSTGIKTNISDSLNSLSLTTTNLAFALNNGYGTAFYFSRLLTGTNYGWANISCGGGVNLTVNNIGVWLSSTNSANATNAVGPAHGTFSTVSGTFKK